MSNKRDALEKAYLAHSCSLEELNSLVDVLIADALEKDVHERHLFRMTLGPHINTGKPAHYCEMSVNKDDLTISADEFIDRFARPMIYQLLEMAKRG